MNPNFSYYVLHEDEGYISSRRLFNAHKTNIKTYPFMASVEIFNKFHCGGSIIENDLVLTAASCLQLAWNNRFYRENPAFLQVRVGSSYFEVGGEVIGVRSVYFHPEYNPKNLQHNIAILRLVRLINFKTRQVKKIKLDTEGSALPMNTANITVLGWGMTKKQPQPNYDHKLKCSHLELYLLEECQNIYSSAYVTKFHFCAGYITKGSGACNRDIGGPGVVYGKLTGIISFGAPICGTVDAPTVFIKIGYYCDWIEEIMEEETGYVDARTTTAGPKKWPRSTSTFNPYPQKTPSNIRTITELPEETRPLYGTPQKQKTNHVNVTILKTLLKTMFESNEIEDYIEAKMQRIRAAAKTLPTVRPFDLDLNSNMQANPIVYLTPYQYNDADQQSSDTSSLDTESISSEDDKKKLSVAVLPNNLLGSDLFLRERYLASSTAPKLTTKDSTLLPIDYADAINYENVNENTLKINTKYLTLSPITYQHDNNDENVNETALEITAKSLTLLPIDYQDANDENLNKTAFEITTKSLRLLPIVSQDANNDKNVNKTDSEVTTKGLTLLPIDYQDHQGAYNENVNKTALEITTKSLTLLPIDYKDANNDKNSTETDSKVTAKGLMSLPIDYQNDQDANDENVNQTAFEITTKSLTLLPVDYQDANNNKNVNKTDSEITTVSTKYQDFNNDGNVNKTAYNVNTKYLTLSPITYQDVNNDENVNQTALEMTTKGTPLLPINYQDDQDASDDENVNKTALEITTKGLPLLPIDYYQDVNDDENVNMRALKILQGFTLRDANKDINIYNNNQLRTSPKPDPEKELIQHLKKDLRSSKSKDTSKNFLKSNREWNSASTPLSRLLNAKNQSDDGFQNAIWTLVYSTSNETENLESSLDDDILYEAAEAVQNKLIETRALYEKTNKNSDSFAFKPVKKGHNVRNVPKLPGF